MARSIPTNEDVKIANFMTAQELLLSGTKIVTNTIDHKGGPLTFAIVNPRKFGDAQNLEWAKQYHGANFEKVAADLGNYTIDLIYFYKNGTIDVRNSIIVRDGYANLDKKKTYIGNLREVKLKTSINLIKE